MREILQALSGLNPPDPLELVLIVAFLVFGSTALFIKAGSTLPAPEPPGCAIQAPVVAQNR